MARKKRGRSRGKHKVYKYEEQVLVSVRLDKDVWRRLKARCVLGDCSIRSVVQGLVEEHLDRNLDL